MARIDYPDDPKAPRPNCIAVACSVLVQADDGAILMIRRSDNGDYSIPGCQLEPGKLYQNTPFAKLARKQESMYTLPASLKYSAIPRHVIAYGNGEVRQRVLICFRASIIGGPSEASEESPEVI